MRLLSPAGRSASHPPPPSTARRAKSRRGTSRLWGNVERKTLRCRQRLSLLWATPEECSSYSSLLLTRQWCLHLLLLQQQSCRVTAAAFVMWKVWAADSIGSCSVRVFVSARSPILLAVSFTWQTLWAQQHMQAIFTSSDKEGPAQFIEFVADEGDPADQEEASSQSWDQPEDYQHRPESPKHWKNTTRPSSQHVKCVSGCVEVSIRHIYI